MIRSEIAEISSVVAGFEAAGMAVRKSRIPLLVCDGVFWDYRDDVNENCTVNRQNNSPSMLLELGFIGNQDDNNIVDARLDAFVMAISDVSCEFLG